MSLPNSWRIVHLLYHHTHYFGASLRVTRLTNTGPREGRKGRRMLTLSTITPITSLLLFRLPGARYSHEGGKGRETYVSILYHHTHYFAASLRVARLTNTPLREGRGGRRMLVFSTITAITSEPLFTLPAHQCNCKGGREEGRTAGCIYFRRTDTTVRE